MCCVMRACVLNGVPCAVRLGCVSDVCHVLCQARLCVGRVVSCVVSLGRASTCVMCCVRLICMSGMFQFFMCCVRLSCESACVMCCVMLGCVTCAVSC